MPSISAISASRPAVGVPPTAAEGCSASASWSEETVVGVVDHAGDVGRQVHDVGEVQHERRLGHVHRRAVRVERVGDRADGVLVLLEVLRRPGQRRGEREVALVVAGAPDGAGQHAGGDQAALAADQQLGRRAEQAVDVERPAHRVVVGQPAQRPADVDRLVGGGDQVAGQHDLLQVAGADPGDGVGDDAHPLLAVERAVGEARPPRARPAGRRASTVAAVSRPPRETVVSQVAVAATADHDLGHDEHGVAGLVGERERCRSRPGRCRARRPRRARRRGRSSPPTTCAASAKRVGPEVRTSAATPQPTRPSPRRSQVTGRVGRQQVQQPPRRRGRAATVRTTRGGSRPGSRWSSRVEAYAEPRDRPTPAVTTSRRSPCRRPAPGRTATRSRRSRAR